MRKRTLPLALIALAILVPEAAAATSQRIIVQHEPGADRADVRDDAGVEFVERLPVARTEVVTAPAGETAAAMRELRADPDVVYAERDRRVHALSDDPDFFRMWGLQRMGVPAAWGMSTGEGRTVAVVDSGVDAGHADLAGNVAPGYDWVDQDGDAADENGHGTHVAGIVAARRDNAVGGVGVAPDARIVPLRVLDAQGAGWTSDVIAAFGFAADRGIRVVNASLGGDASIPAERDVIESNPDTLFVVAAGNGGADDVGDDNDLHATYPCAYDLDNVLCVGASNESEGREVYSNFGTMTVDLFAPGGRIWSTLPGGYGFSSGTSMASPQVAAAAALLFARNPALSVADIKAALMENVAVFPAFAQSVSGGRADVDDALANFDDDDDGIGDGLDNCPTSPNPGQEDANADGVGDACEGGSTDPDGDGRTAADACPDEPANYAPDGCPGVGPDGDGDGLPNVFDACPTAAGPSAGCPLVDTDRDGVPDVSDACPTLAGGAANGCPVTTTRPPSPPGGQTPTATTPPTSSPVEPMPAFVALKAKARRRTVRLTVRTDRAATVGVTIQRKRCRRGKKCRWVRVTGRILLARDGSATLRLKRLKRGSYRAVVTLSSRAGTSKPRRVRFRIR